MINALAQASALNAGSDLWVTTDLAHSKWSAKLDWYLNFQIVKASRHQTTPLSSFLRETLNQTGLSAPDITLQEAAPLLIQSEILLPNKWVAVIPFDGDLTAWLKSVTEVWTGLQKPSLRLFLPTGQNARSIPAAAFSSDISVVADLTH